MNLEKGETSIFITQEDISNREIKQGWGSRWCKVQVSGEGREKGIQGTGVGIFECEGEWVVIQDRKKDGISKKEPTFAIQPAFKCGGLHIFFLK